MLRYRRHHYMADGIHSKAVAAEFMEHSLEEQQHADTIAERIRQLGGAPDFNPEGLAMRSHAGILATEEEHADDMSTLLENLGPSQKRVNPTEVH